MIDKYDNFSMILKMGKNTFYPHVVWFIYKLPTYGFKIDTLFTSGIIC
jgi:hypothetical protein